MVKRVHVLTYINLLHIPLVMVTNGAVLVLIYQIKRLHNPYNYIVFALALADFMYFVVPVARLLDDFGDRSLIRGSFIGCLSIHVVPLSIGQVSLNMILLLTFDRLFSLCFPIWYRNHMSNCVTVTSAMAMLLPEIVFCCVIASLMTYNEDEPNVLIRCSLTSMPSFYKQYYKIKMPSVILTVITLTALTYRVVVRRLERKFSSALDRYSKDTAVTITSMEQARANLDMKKAIQKAAANEIRHLQITFALVLLFIIFVLPQTIAGIRLAKDETPSNWVSYRATAVWKGFNASVNAFVYALSRPDFKDGFKFMFTNRPCSWKYLNRHITRLSIFRKLTITNNNITAKNIARNLTMNSVQFAENLNAKHVTPSTSFTRENEHIELKDMLAVSSRSGLNTPRRATSRIEGDPSILRVRY